MNPDAWMTDEASIGRIAKTPDERRLALNACLLVWNIEDIGRLQRVDSTNPEWHGWTMTRWHQE
jgi:hypothetical protein